MKSVVFAGMMGCFLLNFMSLHAEEKVRPSMGEFMGINGHTVQFKPTLYAPTGRLVRDYHPVEWDLGKETSVGAPFPEAKNRVNWQSVYGSWRKAGYDIDVCLMFESIPRENWKDLGGDAEAYGETFAREFGPSGARKLVDSVEIGNEPGKWSDADYRTLFAAMAAGLRKGDSKLPIATCNLTVGPGNDYAKSVVCLEGLEKFYDILTVHTYAQLEGWPTWRRSFPEDPLLQEYLPDVEKLCQWRDQHVPGKPVWITEFGYDSSTQTPVKNDEFKKWVGVSDLQQAQWLVRSYLVFSSMAVDRAYLYFFNDADEPKLHAAAGLTRNFRPKPSYYAVSQLYATLGNYRFNRVVKNEKELRVQEYQETQDPKNIIWVAWSPTGGGVVKDVLFEDMPAEFQGIERMWENDAQTRKILARGVDYRQKTGGAVEIQISESPVYLFFGKRPK